MNLQPHVYRVTQTVFAPGGRSTVLDTLRRWCERHDAGALVLDVGCGPRSWLAALGLRPIGVDRSEAAVRASRAGSGPGVVADATALPFCIGCFDSGWCVGLLHHLPDTAAATALRELQRVIRPSRPVVVFDGIRPTSRGRLAARVVRRLDRGRWMRSQAELRDLLDGAGTWHGEAVRYSALGLEGVLATSPAHHQPDPEPAA